MSQLSKNIKLHNFIFTYLKRFTNRVERAALGALFFVIFYTDKLFISPPRKELHRSDMELLSVRDVLNVGELHSSPHRTSETLIQAGRAHRRHQLQACADHVTHNCKTK